MKLKRMQRVDTGVKLTIIIANIVLVLAIMPGNAVASHPQRKFQGAILFGIYTMPLVNTKQPSIGLYPQSRDILFKLTTHLCPLVVHHTKAGL